MRYRPINKGLVRLFTASFILAALFSAGLPSPARAQTQVIKPSILYQFAESLTVQARIQSDQPVQEVAVLFGSDGEPHLPPGTAKLAPDGTFSYTYDLTNRSLRAFANVNYRFRVTFQDGQVYTSPNFSFLYADNRFAWQVLDEAPFRIHWYAGSLEIAQVVADVAHSGLERIQSLLTTPSLQDRIDIYVYNSAREMQTALDPTGQVGIAGHADPDLGVMIVALPPGPDQRALMEQRVPHELMHVLLYRKVGPEYAKIPLWLNEGLASAAELYPNPDYQVLLENAHEKNSLLSMGSLCQAFPRDASGALLAYAQSASFTRYLFQTYGASGINDLIQNYADGMECGRGVDTALGKSLTQLERMWRQSTFTENLSVIAFTNLLPWLVLMLAALGAPFLATIGKIRS